MYWSRTTAVAVAVGAACAATVSSAAIAAESATPGLGTFRSWTAAQSAAGFRLLKPTATYGDARSGKIIVTRCGITGKKAGKRLVLASYGLTPFSTLSLSQNNSGGPCASTGRTTPLGRYKIHGIWARMSGLCGRASLPACSSRKILLMLTWRAHGAYYVASSFGRSRRVLAGFARKLAAVG